MGNIDYLDKCMHTKPLIVVTSRRKMGLGNKKRMQKLLVFLFLQLFDFFFCNEYEYVLIRFII